MSATNKKLTPGLAEGQVWKVDNAYLHIVEAGRRMMQYRIIRHPVEKPVATQMIGIEALAVYLKATEATLMN